MSYIADLQDVAERMTAKYVSDDISASIEAKNPQQQAGYRCPPKEITGTNSTSFCFKNVTLAAAAGYDAKLDTWDH